MSIKTKKIQALTREIERLKAISLKFKKRMPLAIALGIPLSFLYPFLPRKMFRSNLLTDTVAYENVVLLFGITYYTILTASYYIIKHKNQKKINSYVALKQRLKN